MTAPAPIAPNSGRNMANWGNQLITKNNQPPGHILYQEGGDANASDPDPRLLDCSSLIDWVFFHATGNYIVSGGRSTTGSLTGWAPQTITQATALATKGAIIFSENGGHVELSLGNGNTAAARTNTLPPAQQVSIMPASTNGYVRSAVMPGINYGDAATNPAAAAELTKVLGYPVTVTDPNEFGAGVAGAGGGATGGPIVDAFNETLNVFTWGFNPSYQGNLLGGPRAMMNDTPFLPYLNHMLSATFRHWCSAPNGDFIAWFPDFFGIFGTAATMNVKSIELQDFTVEWQDQNIVTHQYVVGVPVGMFNQADGTFSAQQGEQNEFAWELQTGGIATMDFPDIFKTIYGAPASKDFIDSYLKRFGGRPDMQQMASITQGSLMEFFMALYLFMQKWAAQFQAQVPMTFMPELWPGMLLALPEFNFQAYITEVQHSFKFGEGGGFQTQASICAPARTDSKDSLFGLLPLGGAAAQAAVGAGQAQTKATPGSNGSNTATTPPGPTVNPLTGQGTS